MGQFGSHLFDVSSIINIIIIFFFLLIGTNFISASNPWEGFHNLSGCHAGERRTGLASLKKYLHQFGYLPTNNASSDEFDDTLHSALLAYQKRFHLNATGTIDSSTVDVMVRPRCGVADVVNGTNTTIHGRNLYTYFQGTPTWNKRSLTYAFDSTSHVTIEQSVLRTVVTRAFARWSDVTPLSFTETNSNFPDITIGFYRGDHGDGEAFDGSLGTLAHAFSPTDGRFHLDADERWVAAEEDAASPELIGSNDAVDLESVAVHEIGHLIGLGHSTVEGAIMYPLLRVGERNVQLAEDDVSGIQSLYGSNPNYNGNAVTNSPSTTTTTGEDTSGSGAPVAGAGKRLVVAVIGAVTLATLLL